MAAPEAPPKRPFERVGADLVDRYTEPGSRQGASTHITSRAPLGHPPRPARALRAPSQARVGRWVARLLAGDWKALGDVVEHREFPGVREALIAAAAAPLPATEIVTSALGQVGGPGAREVLARELAKLVGQPATYQLEAHANQPAARLTLLARDLLRPDPDSVDAARALMGLFGHPVAYNRMYAVWNATEVFVRLPARLTTGSLLQEALAPLQRTRDPELFVKAIPALWWIDHDRARRRIVRTLNHPDPWIRHEVVNSVLKITWPVPFDLLPVVIRWLGTEASLRLVAEFAQVLGGLVPAGLRRDIATRALADASPSLRRDGVWLLEHLDATTRRALADEALRDEPDPALRKLLRARRDARR